MAEYTYKDVIIDPDDPRVEIGGKYYFDDSPYQCLCNANNNAISYTLQGVDVGSYHPFIHDCIGFICLIRKKEPEKKYVPFDLSREEDRQLLRDSWIKSKYNDREAKVSAFKHDETRGWLAHIPQTGMRDGEQLFNSYTFLDGTPCGKLVEVDE